MPLMCLKIHFMGVLCKFHHGIYIYYVCPDVSSTFCATFLKVFLKMLHRRWMKLQEKYDIYHTLIYMYILYIIYILFFGEIYTVH